MNAHVRRGEPMLRAALALAFGVALGAGALVWTRTEILSLRYEHASLLERESELLGEVEKLRVEAAALSAPERIERRAQALGLRYPRAGQIIPASEPTGAGQE